MRLNKPAPNIDNQIINITIYFFLRIDHVVQITLLIFNFKHFSPSLFSLEMTNA